MVVIVRPSQRAASVRQDTTVRPSTWTVHAPQDPRSHPFLVPVSPAYSRSASSSEVRGSIDNATRLPFTCSVTSILPGSAAAGVALGAGCAAAPWTKGSAKPAAVPPITPRRVTLNSSIQAPSVDRAYVAETPQVAPHNTGSGV